MATPVNYLQIEKLTKSYGDRVLFSDVDLTVAQGDKIGLIARNGAGKSTLLSIIAGEEDYDSGKITFRNDIRVAFLPQSPKFHVEKSPLQNLLDSCPDVAPEEAKKFLSLLKVNRMEEPMAKMSGGEVKRVALARVLLLKADLLILDEPTNHLDIDVIEWLQDYLTKSNVTLLMVTHDRYFLDHICNQIVEIENLRTYAFPGSYDKYLQSRDERIAARDAENAKIRNILRTELEWMRRQPQARGSKAKYRIDNFYQLQDALTQNRAQDRGKNVNLADLNASYIGNKIFEARDISLSFGDKCILDNWSYTFARHDKIGLIGPNGVGKTTLLKILQQEIAPDAGTIEIGQTVRWGYYAQKTQIPKLDPDKRVIDVITDIAEDFKLSGGYSLSPMQLLQRFLFTVKEQQKKVSLLSGGELRRLYLATILVTQPNFLILDEPTNDLDLLTLNILEEYLAEFKGCLIIVSHDRHFIDRIVNHLFVMEGDGKIRDFPGDYSTYRHCLLNQQKEAQAQERPKEARTKQRSPSSSKGLTFKQKREFEALNASLPELRREKAELEATLQGAQQMDFQALTQTTEKLQQVNDAIDETEMRLLELLEIDPTLQI